MHFPVLGCFAAEADVDNTGITTFAAGLYTTETGFHMLEQGSTCASGFVELPIEPCDWPKCLFTGQIS